MYLSTFVHLRMAPRSWRLKLCLIENKKWVAHVFQVVFVWRKMKRMNTYELYYYYFFFFLPKIGKWEVVVMHAPGKIGNWSHDFEHMSYLTFHFAFLTGKIDVKENSCFEMTLFRLLKLLNFGNRLETQGWNDSMQKSKHTARSIYNLRRKINRLWGGNTWQ